jgi:hypothetical protein
MSNPIAIETPTTLQASQAVLPKTVSAAENPAGQNATASSLAGDDVLLAAQGRLDNVRAIMSAINADQGDDEGLIGAKSPDELISIFKSQIPNLSGILVPTGRSPQALLALLR